MKKIITIGAVLALLIVAYRVGQHKRSWDPTERQMKRELEFHNKLFEIDRFFLTNVVTRPNTLTTGTYIMETTFPDRSAEIHTLKLVFSNGQLLKEYQHVGRNLVTNGFTQEGKVVSGAVHDMDEGPTWEYIGVVDGNTMWGRVYQPPGQGWRKGEPPAYGVWKLRPQSEQSDK